MTTAEPSWDKPGPGSWDLDASHSGAAPGPALRDLIEHGLERGMTEGFALFGAPLKSMQMRWVNGKFYRRLVPLVGGDRDTRPPPARVLWLAMRLHPAFRRNERRARESFETKRWRDELRRWEEEWKPAIVKANLAFTDIEAGSLSDAELAEHLRALWAHLEETVTLHFRLHVSDMGPLGDLMVHLEDWGLGRDDTFRALVAASPATRAPLAQLRGIVAALRDAGVDPSSLTSLDQVRAVSPDAGARLDEYVRFHGPRLTTGYDLEDRTLAELPDVIVASIRGAAATGDRAGNDASDEALATLRAEIPAEHRAHFDDLAEDARLSYGLRDENGPITYEWPGGLLRLALLEAGTRLAAAGRVADGSDVFELAVDEVTAMLDGASQPDLTEIAARAAERRWWAGLEPPARLGPEEPPPPVSVMPTNLGRLTRIVLTVVDALEADATAEPLSGMGIGDTTYVGTARVVHDAVEALGSVEPGDVIVAPYTAPTYNAVLGMAGAIVTEEGGLLCHAAVIARELGLPAVIGAADAMSRIPDGATVEVDPVAGRVRLLA
jgi:pyruvate,water dikinase